MSTRISSSLLIGAILGVIAFGYVTDMRFRLFKLQRLWLFSCMISLTFPMTSCQALLFRLWRRMAISKLLQFGRLFWQFFQAPVLWSVLGLAMPVYRYHWVCRICSFGLHHWQRVLKIIKPSSCLCRSLRPTASLLGAWAREQPSVWSVPKHFRLLWGGLDTVFPMLLVERAPLLELNALRCWNGLQVKVLRSIWLVVLVFWVWLFLPESGDVNLEEEDVKLAEYMAEHVFAMNTES